MASGPHLMGIDAAFLLWPFTSPSAAAELAPGVVNAIARQVPRIVYLSAHAAAGRPDSFWAQVEHLVEASAAAWTFLRAAGFAANALIWAEFVRKPDYFLTTTVQELTGTPARSFGQWAADHADDFR